MTRDIEYLGIAEMNREEALRIPAYAKKFLAEYDRLKQESKRRLDALGLAYMELEDYLPENHPTMIALRDASLEYVEEKEA
jgi:hypothetical protein